MKSPEIAPAKGKLGILTPGSFHAPFWDPYGEPGLTGADYVEQVLFKKLTDFEAL